tara:strand:- start:318 stop:668 length:351 start_codon:yes stop_codon:yes gene_type:complete
MKDETEAPWYLAWCHYTNIAGSYPCQLNNPSRVKTFEELKAHGRALKSAKDNLINNFPEFFKFIEWDHHDFNGNGDTIFDDFLEKYYPFGLPVDFHFHFESAQNAFENYYFEGENE